MDIRIRSYEESDLEALDEIWNKFYKGEFSLPDLSNTVTHAVAEKHDRIIAFGMVKYFAEAVMIMDGEANIMDKVRANDLLLAKAFEDSREAGLNQIHVCVALEDYARLLQNKYGFKQAKNIILVKEL